LRDDLARELGSTAAATQRLAEFEADTEALLTTGRAWPAVERVAAALFERGNPHRRRSGGPGGRGEPSVDVDLLNLLDAKYPELRASGFLNPGAAELSRGPSTEPRGLIRTFFQETLP
jgi:hypothetical protein